MILWLRLPLKTDKIPISLLTALDSPRTTLSEYFHLPFEILFHLDSSNQVGSSNENGFVAVIRLLGNLLPDISPESLAMVKPGEPPASRALRVRSSFHFSSDHPVPPMVGIVATHGVRTKGCMCKTCFGIIEQ